MRVVPTSPSPPPRRGDRALKGANRPCPAPAATPGANPGCWHRDVPMSNFGTRHPSAVGPKVPPLSEDAGDTSPSQWEAVAYVGVREFEPRLAVVRHPWCDAGRPRATNVACRAALSGAFLGRAGADITLIRLRSPGSFPLGEPALASAPMETNGLIRVLIVGVLWMGHVRAIDQSIVCNPSRLRGSSAASLDPLVDEFRASALTAPIRRAGVVLPHPPKSTAASSGWLRLGLDQVPTFSRPAGPAVAPGPVRADAPVADRLFAFAGRRI